MPPFCVLRGPVTHAEKKEQFRDQVISLYLKELLPIPEVARKLGISGNMAREIMRESGRIRCLAERRASSLHLNRKNFATGYFHSAKSGKWFPAASSYEFLRMQQLDNMPDVAEWDRNVPWVKYGQNRRYVPDFFVKYTDGRMVIEEVKPALQVNDVVNLEKWQAAREQLRGLGYGFQVITEDDLGWDNIKSFQYTGFASLPEDEKAQRKAEYKRQYRETNKERLREWHRMARINNPEKYKRKDRAAIAKYQEQRKTYRKKYYSDNRSEIIEKTKTWCDLNKERRKAYMKNYYQQNKHKWQVTA